MFTANHLRKQPQILGGSVGKRMKKHMLFKMKYYYEEASRFTCEELSILHMSTEERYDDLAENLRIFLQKLQNLEELF